MINLNDEFYLNFENNLFEKKKKKRENVGQNACEGLQITLMRNEEEIGVKMKENKNDDDEIV